MPFRTTLPVRAFRGWDTRDQTVVDIGSVRGTDGRLVDRQLCGVSHPNALDTTLPRGSIRGTIALVFRGGCAIVTKEIRALLGGAEGMILVDNRPGEPTSLPLDIPAGTIADLDGARLRDFLVSVGGSAAVRFSFAKHQLHPGRGGTMMFFSSAGPTAFGHLLKPDVSAPGGEILSSTLPEFARAPFAPFDGTSMSAPHVAGAAALLLQRHPTWTTPQVRSALVSTAGPAWADTARTTEASVLLEGGGVIDIPRADDPQVFTTPSALSFGDLNANRGAVTRPLTLEVTDAGGGSGMWTVEVRPQSASTGASLEAPGLISLAPGGRALLPVAATASANAPAGDNFGFLVLRRGAVTRRIPYAFFVTRPALEGMTPRPLRRFQNGTTANGSSRVNSYRWPSAPFGYPPSFTGPPMIEDGAERVYVVPHLKRPVVNFGVGVVGSSRNAVIDPWLLGSLDENDVQGETGTPMNVNPLTFDFGLAIGAAGVIFPSLRRYYVVVDSTQDLYTGTGPARSLPPPLLGQRPQAARRQAAHAARGGRPADARGQSAGPRRRRRSVLDADRLPGGRGRRGRVRLELGHRRLRAAGRGSEGRAWTEPHAHGGLRLPGVEEREHVRPERDAEYALPLREHQGSAGDDDHMAPPASPRLPSRQQPGAARAREHDEPDPEGALLQRASLDRNGSNGHRRAVLDHVAGRACAQGAAPAACGRDLGSWPGCADLAGRSRVPVAVVTGGATGIGAAVARKLTEREWRCVLVGRREDRLRATADEIGGEYEVCDVADRDAVWRMAAAVRERHPELGLLVNNAGIAGRGNYLDLPPERIEELVRINYLGSVWCLLSLLPALEAGAPSHLVNIVSVAGTVAIGPYSASKHAQLAFSRSVARELRPRGIHVHSVNPGFVHTEGFPQDWLLRGRFGRLVVGPGARGRSDRPRDRARPAGDLRPALVPRRRACAGDRAWSIPASQRSPRRALTCSAAPL